MLQQTTTAAAGGSNAEALQQMSFSHLLQNFDLVGWIVFLILTPFLGVLVYLIANNHGMTERNVKQAQAQRAQFDDYVRSVSGGSAAEIEKAKALLDAGTITQAEFDAIKSKALA